MDKDLVYLAVGLIVVLLIIHGIAYIVSADYREWCRKEAAKDDGKRRDHATHHEPHQHFDHHDHDHHSH